MKRILIIEDNENNQVLIERLLQTEGFQTLTAATGQSGVALALEEKPDAILLDVDLPDMSGTEVLARLQESAGEIARPIIVMTSYAMAEEQEEMLALGCTGYMDKPYDPATVVEKIRGFLMEAQREV